METKTWLKIAAILTVLGIVLFIINYLVYAPRLAALGDALTKSRVTNSPPPNPQTFGLDTTSFIITAALSYISISLIFVGVSILIIFLAAWIAQKLKAKK